MARSTPVSAGARRGIRGRGHHRGLLLHCSNPPVTPISRAVAPRYDAESFFSPFGGSEGRPRVLRGCGRCSSTLLFLAVRSCGLKSMTGSSNGTSRWKHEECESLVEEADVCLSSSKRVQSTIWTERGAAKASIHYKMHSSPVHHPSYPLPRNISPIPTLAVKTCFILQILCKPSKERQRPLQALQSPCLSIASIQKACYQPTHKVLTALPCNPLQNQTHH